VCLDRFAVGRRDQRAVRGIAVERCDAFDSRGAASQGIGNGVACDFIRFDCTAALRALLGVVTPGLRIAIELARLFRGYALTHGACGTIRSHCKFPLATRHALSGSQAGNATAQPAE